MQYVAMLRGITPSDPSKRNNRLRDVFVRLGLQNVRSVISSGNILFESSQTNVKELENRIQAALKQDLGITSVAIVRSQQELQRLIDAEPFKGYTHGPQSYLTVTFLKDRPAAAPKPLPQPPGSVVKIVGIDASTGAVFAVNDATHTKTPDFMQLLEREFGKNVTTRTWKTVERILKKLSN